jgi:6-phosphogluconolactonase
MTKPSRRSRQFFGLLTGLCLVASLHGEPQMGPGSNGGAVRVYVGTYTSAESKGIYRLRLDLATGTLTPEGEPTEVVNPSFLALHPSGRFLYAVNEVGDEPREGGGSVSAFAVDRQSGALTLLNQQPSRGAGPCHISLDKEGRFVLVANYSGGSVSVLPVQPDGRLGAATGFVQHEGHGVNPRRQERPHAHSINLDPAGRFAVVADLGLDELRLYRFEPVKGTLALHGAAHLAPGAGPRHFCFHPNGRYGYVINEIYSTITAFVYDAAAGALSELQTVSTLPRGSEECNDTAEVAVRADGRFLYGSNRGHDSLAIFAIDPATGKLRSVGDQPTLGKTPRNFAIDPTSAYLLTANQNSNTVVAFRIDPESGGLTPVGSPVHIPHPVCLQMVRVERSP